MTILIDGDIERLNPHGGIATIWREVRAPLEKAFGVSADPDVKLLTYYGRAGAKKTAVVVYDFIADVYPFLRGQQDIIWKRQAIEVADVVIAISPWVALECKRITGRDAKVIPMGTTFIRRTAKAAADIRKRYNLPEKFVLTAGRRDHYKNVRALYQAWPLVDRHDELMIVCAGGGQPTREEVTFSQRHQWRWLDHVPTGDLEALYAAASAVVYPSIYEGYGLPVLDAFATGTPVLCRPSTGLSFAQGLCEPIDPYRPRSIAAALERVIWQRDAAIDDRCRAAMTYASTAKWSRTADALIDIVRGLHDA